MSVVTRIRTSQEITVPFTPEEVWGVLADVAAYPEWWPSSLGVEILHHAGDLLGAEFEVRPWMGRMFRIRFEELEGPRSMRLRFFGGSLEGPGGFHLHDLDGATEVRYEMDVFARGLDVAVLSQLLPPELVHRSRMRRVLNSLASRLKAVRKAGEREARSQDREGALRLDAEEDAARHPAEELSGGEVGPMEPGWSSSGSVPRPLWGRIVNWLGRGPAVDLALTGPAAESGDSPGPNRGVSNFDLARRYLEALSSRATPEEIGSFFAPEATDEEFAHRFLETPVMRGFAGILETRASALSRFSSQRYELARATGGGSQVAMEVRWNGSVARTGEGFLEGQELDARIALFLKFTDGRIARQRTYACFEPWSTAAERLATLDERVAQAGASAPALTPVASTGLAPPAGSNFEVARAYLEELGTRAGPEAIARFFAPGAVQEVFPNPWLPGGAHRDLQAIKQARSRDLASLSSENYELMGATGGGSMVALEAAWTGVAGETPGLSMVGQRLQARVAIFLKFRNGLILSQRNY